MKAAKLCCRFNLAIIEGKVEHTSPFWLTEWTFILGHEVGNMVYTVLPCFFLVERLKFGKNNNYRRRMKVN
jgi:hypothetical protein